MSVFVKYIIVINIISCTYYAHGQIEPIWDIGTKWTYELRPNFSTTSFVTNEIVDTVTIDSLKLYVVQSDPIYTGIRYFHYSDDKVYNYNPYNKILQLLYDFESTETYMTDYRPICDPDFDYDSLVSKVYTIKIDSIVDFLMPDGSVRNMQYTSNEGSRLILSNIGFMSGYLHHTHDWELGASICGELGDFVTELRCFENDSIQYNFITYPCDSIWTTVSVGELKYTLDVSIYPNPTQSTLRVTLPDSDNYNYTVMSISGRHILSGTSDHLSELELDMSHIESGMYQLQLTKDDQSYVTKFLISN